MLFTGTRIHIVQILHIYGVSVVICGGLLTRLAAANHHKPPPKRRKYAGFGTMGIPAIRESIVLHRQGLATLREPNYLGAIQVLRNAFFWKLDPHPPPCNANNIEPHRLAPS